MEQTPVSPLASPNVGMNAHLSADDLSAMVDGRLPDARRAVVEAHLAVCADCRAELVSASAIVDSAPPARVRRTKWVASGMLAAAAVLAIVIVPRVTRHASVKAPSDPTRRGSAPNVITIVDPAPSVEVARDSIRFVWRGQRGATYRLFVTDSAGLPLLKMPTSDTVVVPPADLQLLPGARYFWYVDALRPDGSSPGTAPSSFTIRAR